MKFEYKTVTEPIEIDVDEKWVAILEDLDREEYNNDHKEKRRHYHFDACSYEGDDFAVEDAALDEILEKEAARKDVTTALAGLSVKQRQLIDALFFRDMSVQEYADSRGVYKSTISESKTVALKKLKKFLEKNRT